MILKHQNFELIGKTILERVIFKPPLRATESMQDEACLIYSVNGHSKFFGETGHDTLSPEEGVLVKCGSFVNYWQVSDKEEPSEAVAIHFYPEVLRVIYEDQMPDFLLKPPVAQPKLFLKVDAAEAMRSYINSLLYYFDHPELCTEDLIRLKLRELILLLYNTNSNGIRELLADMFNPQKVAFKEVIKEHLWQDLTLEDYAQLTNLSLSSFKRKFKEVYQESPARYIRNKRLDRAAELLRNPQARIADVCYDCGFNDPGHFSKSFVARFQLSPSEYQKENS